MAALLLAAGSAQPIWAQTAQPPGRYHLRPLWLSPKLELKNAGVDTNVFNSDANPIPDTSVALRPSPSRRAAAPWRSGYASPARATSDFNYFQRRGSERSVDFGGDGKVETKLRPLHPVRGRRRSAVEAAVRHRLDERLRRQEKFATAGFQPAPSPGRRPPP